MKTLNGKMKIKALALAVQCVLVAMATMPAYADDEEAAALKKPTSTIEFGGLDVSHDSAKFGEYTGYNKNGPYFLGSFSVLSGKGESDDTRRWAITGSDLGTTSRNLGATISDQGRWKFGIGYDALTHYTSDSYQTPYQGTMGGNSFTLPSGFGTVADTRAMNGTQLGSFQTMNINNTRNNTSLSAGYNVNRQWEVKVDYNQLQQSGAKLMAFGAFGFSGASGEKISILPMPQSFKTDTLNAAINWTGEKAHATGSYFGSYFRDNNNGVKFDTWGGANTTQTMTTYPSNDFHQLNLNGGYAFTARTKLAGGMSYGRNTQNTDYGYDSGLATGATGGGVGPMVNPSPTNSLNGFVATTHADLKLTDQTTKDLALSASYKYDDRDNRTASNIYSARAIDGNPNNRYDYPNTPISIKRTAFELAGDYRLDAKQKVRLALNHDTIDRHCRNYASGGGAINAGSFPYTIGTNCVTATSTKDDKVGATYRLKASNDVNLNVGYGYSNRKTTFDENARAAFIGTDGSAPGPTMSGINGGDYRGFHPFFEASRKQHMLKAGTNWQATDKLSLGAGGRYAKDDYDQALGVQKGTQWSLNLDSTYAYREGGSITGYVTQQQRTRDVTDQQGTATASATRLAVPVGATWSNKLKDADTTLGLNAKQAGLMGGKLELGGDLTYTRTKTSYETMLNYNTTTTGGLTCSDPSLLSCGSLPDIKSTVTQVKLYGNYQLDKNAKVTLGYLFRRLHADDYYYNGLQTGSTPTGLMPTNQVAPDYKVNVVWASYMYSFK